MVFEYRFTSYPKVQKCFEFLKKKYAESSLLKDNPTETQYRIEHSIRVALYGIQIAIAEGMDVEAVGCSCILHDVSYCIITKSDPDYQKHGWLSADISKPLFEELGFSGQILTDMLYSMAYHSKTHDGFPGARENMMTKTVLDCDLIDRYDFWRVYTNMAKKGFEELPLDERAAWVDKRFEELDKKRKQVLGSATARKLLDEKLDFQYVLLNQLKKQQDMVLPS